MNLHTEMTFAHQFPESDTTGGTTENTESSNETAAQGQSQSSGKPIGSAAARFQIRSAKTLQCRPTSQNVLEDKSQAANDRFYESDKSKSLDWRGAGTRSGYGNTAGMSSGTRNFGQSFIRRADSLDRKEANNKITSYTDENQPNSLPWRIQAYNVSEQGDRKVYPVSGSTSRVVQAIEQAGSGQSLPTRLKPRHRQGSIGDDSSLWAQMQQGESSLDYTDHRMGYWTRGQVSTSTEEVTGNQTIMERIKKLYGGISTETDSNARDLTIEKRNCISDFDNLNPDTINSIPHHRKSSTDSPSGILSPDSQQRRPSYTVEKAGTFPRWFSKNEQTFFNQMQETSRLEDGNDQRDSSSDIFPKPKWSMETSSGNKFQLHLPEGNEETRSPEFNSRSLERTRNMFSETAQSKGHRTHGGLVIQSSCSDGSSNISNQSVKRLATTSAVIKEEIEKQEPDQPKYPLASGGSTHSEKLEEEDIFTVKTEGRREDDDLETPQSPSSDSVKNTIHKFEALAQQNKSTLARRALSVPGQPKPVVHVRKSDSDINLRFRKVVGNTEGQGTNLISNGDESEEPKGNVYVNRTSQSNPRVTVKPTSEKGKETYKTSVALIPTFKQLHEPKLDHPISTCDENKTRTVHNRHKDEPELSMNPHTGLPNIGATEEKAKNPTFQSTIFQKSNVNSLLEQQSLHVNMDDDDDDDDYTPTNSPNTDPPTINMQRQSSPGTPAQSVKRTDIGVSTSVKSTANGTQPTAASSHFESSGSTHPVQTIYSSLNNSNNNNYNTPRRDPATVTSMARWSSDEDDDDDYEGTDSDDSDSAESSVTITSNMSQSERKSFSVSLVDLCIYGGVDYKPSDGSESEDDWIPSRSASLSSDISAFSSVTLLSNDELDRLLDDVRNLGDDTLQKYEDVQVVVLHKEVGSGLGFTLAGGVDQNKPVTVHRVIPGGVAAQEGSVFEGAWVLSINGTPLQNCAHWEALRTLRKAKSQAMAVVVLQRSNHSETLNRKETTYRSINTGRRVHVTLNKSSSELGFSLEGGVDSSSGDKPLTVQRIFHGGPVSQVFPGDELLEVQGQSLMGMRRLEAWNLIKRLPPGPVEVVFNRPHQPR